MNEATRPSKCLELLISPLRLLCMFMYHSHLSCHGTAFQIKTCSFFCRFNFVVWVKLSLIVGRPAQPHVEDSEIDEATGHVRVAPLLGVITRLGTYIEGTEAAEDDCDGCEDGAPDKEVFLFFFEHFY